MASEYETLLAIEQSGDLNPVQRTRLEQLRQQYGDSYNSGINDLFGNAITSMVQKIKPYETENPFAFDEALAKEAATKEYSPYYDEQLNDYISGIEKNKSRSQEDLKSTLDFLSAGKEYFLGKNRKDLEIALRNTNEGWAGRGLYFSGLRGRDIAEQTAANEGTVSEYMRGYGYQTDQAKLKNTRNLEDYNLSSSMQTRDVNRQKETAIQGGVLQRKQEAMDEYNLARQKYYDEQSYNLG